MRRFKKITQSQKNHSKLLVVSEAERTTSIYPLTSRSRKLLVVSEAERITSIYFLYQPQPRVNGSERSGTDHINVSVAGKSFAIQRRGTRGGGVWGGTPQIEAVGLDTH